jgi:hypothetical protein
MKPQEEKICLNRENQNIIVISEQKNMASYVMYIYTLKI